MSDDKVLAQSAYTAVIHAPIGRVDIADWLLNLPDARPPCTPRASSARRSPPTATNQGCHSG